MQHARVKRVTVRGVQFPAVLAEAEAKAKSGVTPLTSPGEHKGSAQR